MLGFISLCIYIFAARAEYDTLAYDKVNETLKKPIDRYTTFTFYAFAFLIVSILLYEKKMVSNAKGKEDDAKIAPINQGVKQLVDNNPAINGIQYSTSSPKEFQESWITSLEINNTANNNMYEVADDGQRIPGRRT